MEIIQQDNLTLLELNRHPERDPMGYLRRALKESKATYEHRLKELQRNA